MAVFADRPLGIALIAGEVEPLAADAGDDDDGGVAKFFIAVFDLLRIHRLRRFADGDHFVVAGIEVAGIGAPARTGGTVVFVKLAQRGIRLKSCFRKAFVHRLIIDAGKPGRTAAAVRKIYAVFAEHADLCPRSEGQRVLFVFQQHEPFRTDLDVFGIGVGKGFVFARRLRCGIHGGDAVFIDGHASAQKAADEVEKDGARQYRDHEHQHDQAQGHDRPHFARPFG